MPPGSEPENPTGIGRQYGIIHRQVFDIFRASFLWCFVHMREELNETRTASFSLVTRLCGLPAFCGENKPLGRAPADLYARACT